MLVIRLQGSIETRLARLADATGRIQADLAREAIQDYLDDLEDYQLAEARARRDHQPIPLDDVERNLGLAP